MNRHLSGDGLIPHMCLMQSSIAARYEKKIDEMKQSITKSYEKKIDNMQKKLTASHAKELDEMKQQISESYNKNIKSMESRISNLEAQELQMKYVHDCRAWMEYKPDALYDVEIYQIRENKWKDTSLMV